MKGFVFSLDALIAMLLLITMFITATIYFNQVEFKENINIVLKQIAMDSITVLEKNGKIENAIKQNQVNELRSFLNKLPKSICGEIKIYKTSDLTNPELIVLKENCEQNFLESALIKRSIIVKNEKEIELYLSEIKTWYKREN